MAQEDLLAELLLRKKNIKTPQDAFKFSKEVQRATTDATFANDLRRNYRAGRLMPDPERNIFDPSEWTPGGIAETALIAGSVVPYPPINLASRAGLGLLGLGRMAESAKRSSEGRESGLPGSGKFMDSPAMEALSGALDVAWAPAGVAARKGSRYAPSVAGSLWRRLRGTGRAAEDVPAGGASRVDDVFDATDDLGRGAPDVRAGWSRSVDDAVPKLGEPTKLRVDLSDPEVLRRIKSDDVLAAADKAPLRPRIDAIYNQERQAWQFPGQKGFLTPPKKFDLKAQTQADLDARNAADAAAKKEAKDAQKILDDADAAADKKKQGSLLDEVDEVDEVLNYQQAQERRREELLSGPRTEWLNPDRYFDDMSKAERAVRAARTDPTRGHRALTRTRTLRGPFWEELRQKALVADTPDLGRAGSVDAVIKQLKTLGLDTLEEMGLPLFKLGRKGGALGVAGREVDEAKMIAQFLQDTTRKADFLEAIGRKSELFQATGTDVPSLQAAAVRILETSNPLERVAAQKAVRTLLQRGGDTAAAQTRKELWDMWQRGAGSMHGGLSQDVLVSMEILVKRMETVQEYLKMAFKGEKRGGTVFRGAAGDPSGGTQGLVRTAGREFVQELGGLHAPRLRPGVEGVNETLRNKMFQGLFNNPEGGAETIKELGNLWMSLTTMLALMTFGGMGSMPGQGGGLNATVRAS